MRINKQIPIYTVPCKWLGSPPYIGAFLNYNTAVALMREDKSDKKIRVRKSFLCIRNTIEASIVKPIPVHSTDIMNHDIFQRNRIQIFKALVPKKIEDLKQYPFAANYTTYEVPPCKKASHTPYFFREYSLRLYVRDKYGEIGKLLSEDDEYFYPQLIAGSDIGRGVISIYLYREIIV